MPDTGRIGGGGGGGRGYIFESRHLANQFCKFCYILVTSFGGSGFAILVPNYECSVVITVGGTIIVVLTLHSCRIVEASKLIGKFLIDVL